MEKKKKKNVQREECNKYLVVRSCAPKVREKIKELKKTVPQSTEIHASEKSRKRQPFTPIQNICGQPRRSLLGKCRAGWVRPGPFPRPRVCSIPPAPPKGSHGHHPPAYHTHQRPSSAPAAPQCSGSGGAALPVITYGGLFSLSARRQKWGEFEGI